MIFKLLECSKKCDKTWSLTRIWSLTLFQKSYLISFQNFSIFWDIFLYFNHYIQIFYISSFHANAPFLYPLKTSENIWFSDVFREYRNETLAWNGLIQKAFSGWYRKIFTETFGEKLKTFYKYIYSEWNNLFMKPIH